MTKAQERKVNMIRRDAETCFKDMEIKKFEVTDCEYFVAVVAEIGMPEDEGTLAAVFCRYHAQVFIGKRGGMRVPMHKKNGDYYTKKYRNFFSAAYDQKKNW